MLHHHALPRRIAALLLTLAVLGACGDGDKQEAASDSTASTVAPTVPASGAVLLTPVEGAALIAASGGAVTIIDVRTPAEFLSGHVENAINLDVEGGQFSEAIADLDPAATYLVYCQSGNRSALAAATMVTAGFTSVYDMGGLTEWEAAGLPVVTG